MSRRVWFVALFLAVGLVMNGCSSGKGSESSEGTATAGTATTTGTAVASDSTDLAGSATTLPPSSGTGACDERNPHFETGTWKGDGSFSSEVKQGGVTLSETITPGTFTFTVEVDGDGNVVTGTWSVTGMSVAVHAGDQESTATYLGTGTFTGTGTKLLMNGTFDVNSSVGGSFPVPVEDYPVVPTHCEGGNVAGELSPPATAAAEAAGISGGFFAPWSAQRG